VFSFVFGAEPATAVDSELLRRRRALTYTLARRWIRYSRALRFLLDDGELPTTDAAPAAPAAAVSTPGGLSEAGLKLG